MSALNDPSAADVSAAPPAWRPSRIGTLLALLLLLLLAGGVCAVRLMLGDTFGWPEQAEVLDGRVDRVMIGGTVGAALAVAGTLLQALFRNPLASPYVLGLSGGAALGIMMNGAGWLAVLGRPNDFLAALGGAVAVMGIVLLLARRRGRTDPLGLVLVGLIIHAVCIATVLLIHDLMPAHDMEQTVRWLLGAVNAEVGRDVIELTLLVVAAGTLAAILLGRSMDVATFSDTEAYGLGMGLTRLRLWLFLLAAVLTAGAVVLAGPIGFIGLIAPHGTRLLLGPSHRLMLPGAAMAGIALVVGADVAVELLNAGRGRIPLGLPAIIAGGLVFLLLLRPRLGGS